jgi:hypothetical protein
MSESLFLGFGQFSRPDIGLISDSFQNLAEIFESDKRDALRNILIRPEILDRIYGLSEEISREDLRSASGLSRLLLPALHQSDEVFLDRIPTRLFINKEFYSFDYPLGGVGAPTIKTPNVILFNGSIRCQGAQSRTNVIGNSLFGSPVRQTVALSTSRASLFNSEADTVNTGYFKSAQYSGSIRVRRRSHVNRIFVPKATFLTKAPGIENPTHSIRVEVDNGNTGTGTPVKLLATKNTPLRVYCRMATGQVKFTFADSAALYFFGYQIQPLQQRRNSPPVEFLPVTQSSQTTGSLTYTLNIDITTTGYQNLYDLYLYLYVNPEKVTGIEFSGIDIKETPDRKDLGLIGFNNLRLLRVAEGSMTILPLWLKTLRTSLRTLDLASSGDTWRSGPMGWFDIRDPSAVPSFTHPLYTAVSYLTVPKKGAMVNEDGDDWSDELFEKYILNQSRTAGTDYRQFTAVESLTLGDRFYGRSPRFDDIFPNLRNLSWARTEAQEERTYRYLFGSLPKLNNNNSLISYNIFGSRAAGALTDIGTSVTPTDPGHISKYAMAGFNIGGRDNLPHDITGFINDPSQNWSAWLSNTVSIDINRTNVSINLQSGTWSSLVSMNASFSQGAKFESSAAPLLAPKLASLQLYGSNTTGVMATLGASPSDHTNALTSIGIGGNTAISAVTENGIDYLLPQGFAPERSPGSDHKLRTFSVNFSNLSPRRIRARDFRSCYDLTTFNSEGDGTRGRLTGKFFTFPLKRLFEVETKEITIRINRSRFYDLRGLSITPNNFYFARDIRNITAWSQNFDGGGCLLPSFEGTSTTGVIIVDINSSLPSTYPADWVNSSLRGSCVLDEDPETSVSGLTISRAVQPDETDSVYTLTGGTAMRQKVLVNDSVRLAAGGTEVARVMSVSDTVVTIDRDISTALPGTIYFKRNTVPIGDWFKAGFSNINTFRAANCRLRGELNIRSGFSKVVDSSYSCIDLSSNLINGYKFNTVTQIFSGNARKITIDLSSNTLSPSSIRNIISEVAEIDKLGRFQNCLIRLSLNKLTTGNKYSNYTQSEIFPVNLTQGADIITSLFRNETFNIYQEVTTTDEFGNETTNRVQTGTRTVSIPGQLVSGVYYKTRRDTTQGSTENPVGNLFKNLRGIKVDLGFTYTTPSTSTVIISTSYEDVTTRNQSIIDAGYNPADLVNP